MYVCTVQVSTLHWYNHASKSTRWRNVYLQVSTGSFRRWFWTNRCYCYWIWNRCQDSGSVFMRTNVNFNEHLLEVLIFGRNVTVMRRLHRMQLCRYLFIYTYCRLLQLVTLQCMCRNICNQCRCAAFATTAGIVTYSVRWWCFKSTQVPWVCGISSYTYWVSRLRWVCNRRHRNSCTEIFQEFLL